MRKIKYDSFPKEDKERIESDKNIIIKDINIPNPDNPSQQIEAKLIMVRK